MWQVYQYEDMVILGINFSEPQQVVEDFVETFGVTFPVLLDPAGGVYLTYSNGGQSPFPLDYIIDQQGVIRYIATEYDPDEMIRTIEELLGLVTPPPITISCFLVEDIVPEGGYLPFEATITNNTENDIPAGSYDLLVEHFARTGCGVLENPVFTHTLTPGVLLPPGPSIFRFDIGPLPDGTSGLSPVATRISSRYFDTDPMVTDDCCFQWKIVQYPSKREAIPQP